ncbi:hypothetical protein Bca52824_018750 [Brassica carinata]|uniref:RRM domain-containing protein n=1 Tax=Brassica carinata TaxID=52824 RepID=A0A8X7VR59_BRACI|nr:hypothetical protein Bca52824_018750 [Brassica carinata]
MNQNSFVWPLRSLNPLGMSISPETSTQAGSDLMKFLNVNECKAYLRIYGQNLFLLRGFLSIGGDVCKGDTVLFTEKVKESGKIMGRRTGAGQVVKESYGTAKQQHTFTCFGAREPWGFAFVEFVDAYDAGEAQRSMNRRVFAGREITVVVALESRKRPEEMHVKTRTHSREPSGSRGRSHG